MKYKATNPDDKTSLENKTKIFNELYYTKGMMEALMEFSGHIEVGNSTVDHFRKSLDNFISKLHDLYEGTKESEHNLGRNIDYLIEHYNIISWGTWEKPSWNEELCSWQTIKVPCKPTQQELQNLKEEFNQIKKINIVTILRTWRNAKSCHTGTTDQLKKDLKSFKYSEAFKILNELSKIYNKFHYYLTGSSMVFENLSEEGKTYKLTDLRRLELYEGIRNLYFKNKTEEISNDEFLNKIKQIGIF